MQDKAKLKENDVTPENLYLNRRNFIKAGIFAGSLFASGAIYRYFNPPPVEQTNVAVNETTKIQTKKSNYSLPENEALTPFEDITNYNNYYEFSTTKSEVAYAAANYVTRPWCVEVGGLAGKPKVFDLDDLMKFEQEERIYRFRCVEAWSMVIPWVGFPLRKLLEAVEPLSSTKYVAFESYYPQAESQKDLNLPKKNEMQSSFAAGIDFPYVEGLRIDEAYHDLTILATGIYGKPMPNQNGAPIRLVVPWKYGFKSIKSVVKITLTADEPPTTWNIAAPDEYGFYSNVNPDVPHPRWSQAKERRIGELKMRPTLLFNGYAEEVASLYKDMDLKKYF
ncbi:MAG TPA: protein-methionine-sulfoxide reductase catalytic subunit MsrP [Pyrinomonadaceae bacterium]|nr:protein-methionine-sulfoxide reductase catalytic subunit MsrP [Pyrinomonadaceae bacterium]